jgi:hypothetical protein
MTNRLSKTERIVVKFYKSLLNLKHQSAAQHVTRVARLAARTAKYLHKDAKAAYLGGIFHDLGKLSLPPELFNGSDITKEQYEIIKQHPVLAFTALKDTFLFSSLIAGLHHNVSNANNYGVNSVDIPKSFSPTTIKKLLDIATIVSVCDFIDAFTTRTTTLIDSNGSNLVQLLLDKFPNDYSIVQAALLKHGYSLEVKIRMSPSFLYHNQPRYLDGDL